ncbi:Xaa-Pro peptidase family protein [Pigmentiphaga soli]
MNEAADPSTSYEMTFGVEEYRERLRKVRAGMAEAGVDTLLLNSFANIFYLIGHQTTGLANYHCLIVPMEGEPLLVVRRLELLLAQSCSWISEFVAWEDHEDPVEVTTRTLSARGLAAGRLGVEKGSLAVSARAMEQLQAALGGARLVDATGVVEACRRIKSPAEIAYIRRTAEITGAGMRAALAAVRAGVTENHVAAAAVSAMYEAGSEFMSREPTVNSGPRSGIAHTSFKRRVIEPGDTVLLEMSACYNRYSAPLMRVASIGEPQARVRAMSDACIGGLEAGIAAVRPGATAGDIERAVGEVYRAHGLSAGKRAGYSIGIGFPPSWMEAEIIALKRDDPTVLVPGMVFHIVPALREPRQFAVGCSESVLVTEQGHEVLTALDRKLFVK